MHWTTYLAAALAPIAAPLFYFPGRLLARAVWRRLPDGKLRRLLLKDVSRFASPPYGVKRWDQ